MGFLAGCNGILEGFNWILIGLTGILMGFQWDFKKI
jgi:hypothetical protein